MSKNEDFCWWAPLAALALIGLVMFGLPLLFGLLKLHGG